MCNGVIFKNGIPDKHHMSSLLSEVIGIKGQTQVLSGVSVVWVLTCILCQPCGRYIYIFTLASDVIVTSRILNTHSLSSSWVLAATSSTGPVRMEALGTREKTWGRLPFPSGRTTRNVRRVKKKKKLKTCYEEDKHRFPFLFELRSDRVAIRNIKSF